MRVDIMRLAELIVLTSAFVLTGADLLIILITLALLPIDRRCALVRSFAGGAQIRCVATIEAFVCRRPAP